MRTSLAAAALALALPLAGLSAQDDAPHDPARDTAHAEHHAERHAERHGPGHDAMYARHHVGPEADAVAVLRDAAGDSLGVAELLETPANGVLLRVRAHVPAGAHGLHIHETGRCEPPSFSSAGGHYAPRDRSHGMLHPEGMHGGDLPNLIVGHHGPVVTERLTRDVTLREGAVGTLFDADGSAVVIHAGADDYESQPSGDAGGRLLCGVIEAR